MFRPPSANITAAMLDEGMADEDGLAAPSVTGPASLPQYVKRVVAIGGDTVRVSSSGFHAVFYWLCGLVVSIGSCSFGSSGESYGAKRVAAHSADISLITHVLLFAVVCPLRWKMGPFSSMGGHV